MIDFGAHILSDFSDSEEARAESRLILEKLTALGFKEILCTEKFFIEKSKNLPKEKRKEKIKPLNKKSQKLHFADEVFLSPNLTLALKNQKILLLNKSYILLKLPEQGKISKEKVKKVLLEVRKTGLVPILVNPEKSEFLQTSPKTLNEFTKLGVMFQCSFKTAAGLNGRAAEKLMQYMLTESLVDFLATDATEKNDKIFQKFQKSKKKIEKTIGKQGLEKIFRNASGVL